MSHRGGSSGGDLEDGALTPDRPVQSEVPAGVGQDCGTRTGRRMGLDVYRAGARPYAGPVLQRSIESRGARGALEGGP